MRTSTMSIFKELTIYPLHHAPITIMLRQRKEGGRNRLHCLVSYNLFRTEKHARPIVQPQVHFYLTIHTYAQNHKIRGGGVALSKKQFRKSKSLASSLPFPLPTDPHLRHPRGKCAGPTTSQQVTERISVPLCPIMFLLHRLSNYDKHLPAFLTCLPKSIIHLLPIHLK